MKILTKIFIGFNIFFTIYYIYQNVAIGEYTKSLLAFLIVALILIPVVIEKIFKIKIKEYIKTSYHFFILLAFTIGMLMRLYYITIYYDRVVHCLFGVLSSIILFDYIKAFTFRKIIYIIAITLMIALFWEFGEFFCDVIFKTDNQYKVGGASDTMLDLIVAFIGNIVTLLTIKFMYKIKE